MEHSAHAAGRGRGRSRHFFPPCTHCGRQNHVPERCWQKYGRPNNARAAAVTSNPHISADNSSAAVSEPPSEANIMLPKIDYVHLQQQQNFHAVPSTSGSVSAVSHGSSWIIDSGASSHMSGNRSLFSSLRLSSSLPPVSVADGSPSPVHGIGTVRISSTLTLSNVLYVPQFPVNLLSASRLARDHNCSLTFFPSYCVFQDLRTRAMIGGGCETGGLYYLTDRPSGVYSLCDGPGLSHGPYLGTVTLCSLVSLIILSAKACVFAPVLAVEPENASPLVRQNLYLKKSWGMPALFLSSLVFALGHVVIAYRTKYRARRKLLFHWIDLEAVFACKNVFSGHAKAPRSPIPLIARALKSESEAKRKGMVMDEGVPISLLVDLDSLFVQCQGIILHYKISVVEFLHSLSLTSSPFADSNLNCSRPPLSPGKLIYDRSLSVSSRMQNHIRRSFSSNFPTSSLYAPLLADSAISPTFSFDEIPSLSLDDSICDIRLPKHATLEGGGVPGGKFGLVLVHGFGGGVFSWRHIMGALAQQVGCAVVAFDRPGWGLSSRPHRKDWEDRRLVNPYGLESQVDLLLSFCSVMEFSSVVLVGHDDGGLLVLKAAEKVRTFKSSTVEVKGVVLLNVSISRELVPSFARILLHTSLGQKHMVRPLLRAEVTQVIYRHAWYDATKLTTEIMNLYKAPLYIEGWEEALHEIGRLSSSTVLSPEDAASLLKSVEDLPILIVAGAEDAVVSLKSAHAIASRLVNTRLVAISGCGRLPHEECPEALLGALSPFISKLVSSTETFTRTVD